MTIASHRGAGAEGAALSLVYGGLLDAEPGLGPLTLGGFLRDVADRFGPREALVQYLPDGTANRWSYADLLARSLEVAKSLHALGLGKGERVGVMMTNRAEFLSSMFGAALAGGIGVPLSTFSTSDELDHLLGLASCKVLIFERHVLKKDFLGLLLDLEPGLHGEPMGQGGKPNGVYCGQLLSAKYPFLRHVVMLDGAADHADGYGRICSYPAFIETGRAVDDAAILARADNVAPADPAVLFFSSGSTGKPKGILSAHRGVSIQMWRMRGQQGLDERCRYWTANGFFWSGNFAMAVGGVLAAGGAILLQSTFQAEEALTLMQRERATFIFAWPHQWEQLVAAANWDDVDLSSLTHVDARGPIAAHPTVTTDWIEPRHAYGNTETFTLSTAYPANTTAEQAANSHGRVLPGNWLKIVDPLSGGVVPLGDRGEIAIKGPTLMLGYLGIPLDQSVDEEGFFRTGDGGYVDADGRLFWEGRLNDIIKTGGANVSPIEIDDVLITCPGVRVVQTVGIPHETLGELVVSCIIAHDGQTLTEDGVRMFAKQRLASYKVPRRVLFFAEGDLQLTGSAKVKTADLRKLVAARMEHDAPAA